MDPKLISWCPLRIASGPLRWLYLVSFLFFLQIDDWICARKTKKSKKKSNEIEMWSFHNYSLRCYESYKTRAFITCICMYVHSSPKIKHKILKALSKTTWGDWYVGHASTHQLPQVLYEVSTQVHCGANPMGGKKTWAWLGHSCLVSSPISKLSTLWYGFELSIPRCP